MATSVRGTFTESMKPMASVNVSVVIEISGANVRNICTERMSEFAREITCPDWVRS